MENTYKESVMSDNVPEEMPLTEQLRVRLAPAGTLNVSRIHMSAYYDYNFILDCIRDMERIATRISLGDVPNNLERLACMLLCESAYIKLENIVDKENH